MSQYVEGSRRFFFWYLRASKYTRATQWEQMEQINQNLSIQKHCWTFKESYFLTYIVLARLPAWAWQNVIDTVLKSNEMEPFFSHLSQFNFQCARCGSTILQPRFLFGGLSWHSEILLIKIGNYPFNPYHRCFCIHKRKSLPSPPPPLPWVSIDLLLCISTSKDAHAQRLERSPRANLFQRASVLIGTGEEAT